METLIDVSKLIDSQQFIAYVDAELYSIRKARHEITKKHAMLRRSAYDYLVDNKMDTGKDIAVLLKGVLSKKSSLPSSVRSFILQVTARPLDKMIKLGENGTKGNTAKKL